MPSKKNRMVQILLAVCLLAVGSAAQAETLLKPFVLGSSVDGDLAAATLRTQNALTRAGFVVVGSYSPYAKTNILIITNDALRATAAGSDKGGFGAMQRVSVSEVEGAIQVAYTNPRYLANVYRMKGELQDIDKSLRAALGVQEEFGAEGISAEDLREYHYKFTMPYFDEPYELASFKSYDAAIAAVEKGLKARQGGASKIYRIDLPGKKESVFGVAMTRGCSSDEFIMQKIDFDKIKAVAHLPYEMLVSDGNVYALHAKFRIALSFPDLSMMGSNSFFSIMCAPGEIEEALTAVVKGDKAPSEGE